MSNSQRVRDRAPVAAATHRSHARARRPRRRSSGLVGLAYASPAALIVGLFFVVPLALVVWMSLNNWPLLAAPTFNAPANYTRIADNDLVLDAVVFTLKYTAVVTVLLFTISFGLALLVQRRRPGVGLFRGAFFLPAAVGWATATLLFFGLLSDQIGPLNDMLVAVGLIDEPVSWTAGDPEVAFGSTVTLVIWRWAGFNMLILLTGLQTIPTEIYEAARVDGASAVQAFRRITLPLMRPTIALVLCLMVTGSMLGFEQFYILTRGGPGNSTTSVVMVIVREAFVRFNLGSAAAMSVLVLIALVVLNALQLAFIRKRTQ
ncbi:carbohydrate ABC transporter permease [Nonomuraea soli]|uniref:Multiple sugar transport system permease protein n=1 Tax=Nonomuraea soli TaxID=1032476 RepID=A0A7W0CGY5_9ACTN|nr:sugar ABC transporter permease [Nonomuraea soli]MBA2890958.1 multiple sugar transport system permease protein [Nonomuraea soli]